MWLNGAFGVGKTQTAFELHSRIPGSFVFDPEQLGFALRKVVPPSMHTDFQEHPVWRAFTYQGLRYVAENFAGTIIVPMTVVNPLYYDQTVGRLRSEGLQVLLLYSLLAVRFYVGYDDVVMEKTLGMCVNSIGACNLCQMKSLQFISIRRVKQLRLLQKNLLIMQVSISNRQLGIQCYVL